jgi:hypothetical protein
MDRNAGTELLAGLLSLRDLCFWFEQEGQQARQHMPMQVWTDFCLKFFVTRPAQQTLLLSMLNMSNFFKDGSEQITEQLRLLLGLEPCNAIDPICARVSSLSWLCDMVPNVCTLVQNRMQHVGPFNHVTRCESTGDLLLYSLALHRVVVWSELAWSPVAYNYIMGRVNKMPFSLLLQAALRNHSRTQQALFTLFASLPQNVVRAPLMRAITSEAVSYQFAERLFPAEAAEVKRMRVRLRKARQDEFRRWQRLLLPSFVGFSLFVPGLSRSGPTVQLVGLSTSCAKAFSFSRNTLLKPVFKRNSDLITGWELSSRDKSIRVKATLKVTPQVLKCVLLPQLKVEALAKLVLQFRGL